MSFYDEYTCFGIAPEIFGNIPLLLFQRERATAPPPLFFKGLERGLAF